MSRHRGSIELIAEECTSCMLCVRECPVWCISLEAHQETITPDIGRSRTVNVLDEFTIDFGVCMYCGICVDVCPFDALEWVPADTAAERARTGLAHGRERLGPSEAGESTVARHPAADASTPPSGN